MDEGVRLITVADEVEAEVLCGLLRTAGIRCGHRPTPEEDSLVENFGSGGPHEIRVAEDQLAEAQAVLAAEEAGADPTPSDG
jgi:putative signal transducing protein